MRSPKWSGRWPSKWGKQQKAVLSDSQVDAIRAQAPRGGQVKALAAEFGVSTTTIRNAVRGRHAYSPIHMEKRNNAPSKG